MQLRTHTNNLFPYIYQVTTRLTRAISTVSLIVVTLKTLLRLRRTGESSVATIRCMYRDKRRVGEFSQDPDILKNILPSSTSPAINDTLHAYCPKFRNGSFDGDPTRALRSIDVFAREWRRVRWAGNRVVLGRSPEDDDSFTFDLCRFGVREPNSAEIGPGTTEIRVASYRQTDGQTALLSR